MTKLIWLDLETTGLEPRSSTVLEVAVAIADLTDPFNYKHVYQSVITFTDVANLDDFILNMHTKNGLLTECANTNKSLCDVEKDVLEFVPEVMNKEDKPILAGSSIHFDHSFLEIHMPYFSKRLSHRHYDVSALKLFCQSKGMNKFPKAEAHRAKDDIEESVEHARLCDKWLKEFYTADLKKEMKEILSMAVPMGYDSGHSGIQEVAEKALKIK